MINIKVFKITTDEWYPSFKLSDWYEGNKPERTLLVEVSFKELSNKTLRVCIWGNDDLGLERDYPETSFDQAYNTFLNIVAKDVVNKQWLIDTFGFYQA